MPYTITRFETTPNPNALKCWLDTPIPGGPRSFHNAAAAADDPIASSLFQNAGVTNVLLYGEWLTINKPPEADWNAVKKNAREVLAKAQ